MVASQSSAPQLSVVGSGGPSRRPARRHSALPQVGALLARGRPATTVTASVPQLEGGSSGSPDSAPRRGHGRTPTAAWIGGAATAAAPSGGPSTAWAPIDESTVSDARSRSGTPLVTQGDVFTHVLQPLVGATLETAARESDGLSDIARWAEGAGRRRVLLTRTVLMEYVRALDKFNMTALPAIHLLIAEFLAKFGGKLALHQFLQYHVLSESLELAWLLLGEPAIGDAAEASDEAEAGGDAPPLAQLGLDMLRRLRLYTSLVEALLSRGEIMAAMRVVQRYPRNVNRRTARQFFLATVAAARNTSDGERRRDLFTELHAFLDLWQPKSLRVSEDVLAEVAAGGMPVGREGDAGEDAPGSTSGGVAEDEAAAGSAGDAGESTTAGGTRAGAGPGSGDASTGDAPAAAAATTTTAAPSAAAAAASGGGAVDASRAVEMSQVAAEREGSIADSSSSRSTPEPSGRTPPAQGGERTRSSEAVARRRGWMQAASRSGRLRTLEKHGIAAGDARAAAEETVPEDGLLGSPLANDVGPFPADLFDGAHTSLLRRQFGFLQ